MGVMKISFGNMIMELNIFNLDYDEVYLVCLIEEITNEIVSDFSLVDLEMEYFAQVEDDLDLDRLIGQDVVLHKFSLEDLEMECFAPSGDDFDFSTILQQANTMHEPSIEDLAIECFAQCGGDIDFDRILEPARSVGEPSDECQILYIWAP
jgi:hypothetical protein